MRGTLVALAAAAVLAAAGCGTDQGGDVAQDPVGAEPTPSSDPAPSATPGGPSGPSGPRPDERVAVPVYFVRPTPMGPRLIAEWPLVAADDHVTQAAARLGEDPNDPDYHALWPNGLAIVAVSFDGNGDGGTFDVELEPGADLGRPDGMSDAQARLALQQVVRTVQGAGAVRAPVTFSQDGGRVETVLGIDVREPLTAGPDLEELALMNVVTPQEGEVVDGATLDATGLNNGFEATVGWRILDGKAVVAEDAVISSGWMGEELFAWEAGIDVSGLPPGEYTFVALNDDPTGGTEGMGTSEDTKTFVIE